MVGKGRHLDIAAAERYRGGVHGYQRVWLPPQARRPEARMDTAPTPLLVHAVSFTFRLVVELAGMAEVDNVCGYHSSRPRFDAEQRRESAHRVTRLSNHAPRFVRNESRAEHAAPNEMALI